MKKLFVLIIAIISSATCMFAQNQKSVLPANFKAEINYMIPVKFESQSVNGYFVEVKDNNANVYLPYAGEAFSAPMNNDGLNFTEPMTDVKQTTNKKGDQTTLTFNVNHQGNIYRFTITAFDNNTVLIDVNPLTSSSCSYRGDWNAL